MTHVLNNQTVLMNSGSFQPRLDQRSFDLLLDQRSRFPLGLWHFHPLLSSGVHHTRSLLPCIHFQVNHQDLILLFLLLCVHKIMKLWILRHLSSMTMDNPKSFCDFGTLRSPLLLLTLGLSLVCLPPDPTIIGPSFSDLRDEICFSPLCFLCSIGR